MAQATDASPHGPKGLDSQDQVKVFVNGITHPKIDTQQFFESELMKELDSNSKITQHGLECYKFKDDHDGGRCFGKSKNKLISGFYFYISPDRDSRILVRNNEFIYGGVKIEWFTDQKNIDQAKDIDAAIWRLLTAWNVSPIKNNH
ncbi:MAG: hypothetical protein H7Z73_00655 [Candidatus Saccharibacteria bacterium]|nr:hypothetical protein [Moraxellaceae bacterium]